MMLESEAAYATETVPFGAEEPLVVEPQALNGKRKRRLMVNNESLCCRDKNGLTLFHQSVFF
jgi:hypothetical protein